MTHRTPFRNSLPGKTWSNCYSCGVERRAMVRRNPRHYALSCVQPTADPIGFRDPDRGPLSVQAPSLDGGDTLGAGAAQLSLSARTASPTFPSRKRAAGSSQVATCPPLGMVAPGRGDARVRLWPGRRHRGVRVSTSWARYVLVACIRGSLQQVGGGILPPPRRWQCARPVAVTPFLTRSGAAASAPPSFGAPT